jgi:hypothetical protein
MLIKYQIRNNFERVSGSTQVGLSKAISIPINMEFLPDILIYIQTVKKYLESNKNTKDYFLSDVDEDLFFQNLGQIAQINLEKNGEPQLSKEQFEVLRLSMKIFKEVDKEIQIEESIYDYIPNDIKFYLK